MASKAQAIAAPQIFSSDPVEQTFARGVLDPTMGGIAYAYLTAARMGRGEQQQQYMDQLTQSNKMAAALAQQEMENELSIQTLKVLAETANAGIDVTSVPLLHRVFRGGTGDPNVAAALSRAKKQSEINQNNAQAASAGASSRDQIKGSYQWDANGLPTGAQIDVRTGNPALLDAMVARAAEEHRKRFGKGGPNARPTTPEQSGAPTRTYEPGRHSIRD